MDLHFDTDVDELIDKLADGTPCRIGLRLLDGDYGDRACVKAEIDAAVQRMSPRSRRLRFASSVSRLSDAQLEYLTDFDQANHIAWCAFEADGGKNVGIGLARYMRLEDQPEGAEFAVTVVDAYQRRGLGTLLLDRLIGSARGHGIRVLQGYVLPENEAMLRLGQRFDARIGRDESFIRLDIAV